MKVNLSTILIIIANLNALIVCTQNLNYFKNIFTSYILISQDKLNEAATILNNEIDSCSPSADIWNTLLLNLNLKNETKSVELINILLKKNKGEWLLTNKYFVEFLNIPTIKLAMDNPLKHNSSLMYSGLDSIFLHLYETDQFYRSFGLNNEKTAYYYTDIIKNIDSINSIILYNTIIKNGFPSYCKIIDISRDMQISALDILLLHSIEIGNLDIRQIVYDNIKNGKIDPLRGTYFLNINNNRNNSTASVKNLHVNQFFYCNDNYYKIIKQKSDIDLINGLREELNYPSWETVQTYVLDCIKLGNKLNGYLLPFTQFIAKTDSNTIKILEDKGKLVLVN
jgi:hypothetical protein